MAVACMQHMHRRESRGGDRAMKRSRLGKETVATRRPSALGYLCRSRPGLRHVARRMCDWSRKDDTVVVLFVLVHPFLLHPFAMSMIKCAHSSNRGTATHHNMVLGPCILCMSYITEAPRNVRNLTKCVQPCAIPYGRILHYWEKGG